MKNVQLIFILLLVLLPPVYIHCEEDFYWEYLNGPDGGALHTTEVSSKNQIEINSEDHIFICSSSGLFRSTDYGENWYLVLNEFQLRSIAINSKDDICVLGHPSSKINILNSTKDLKNWQQLPADMPADVDVNVTSRIFL